MCVCVSGVGDWVGGKALVVVDTSFKRRPGYNKGYNWFTVILSLDVPN